MLELLLEITNTCITQFGERKKENCLITIVFNSFVSFTNFTCLILLTVLSLHVIEIKDLRHNSFCY